ncbi:uncharacterized protein PV06_05695 [Exophiala oligosperma]|uniref:Uncharacterized protein n=2 Tax=Chaetothyriales TaxID=34395 RepID=A0A0D2DI60_9EURO|nr:uncharacterized protein PV06_05695 [Exophiala oligosperma]KAJ9633857.1 hypothetical protein H2204_006643 [Knufia peltigerae]KIW42110.1 hypothetical protein PV06_05695 [Exophiala oligosperma]
MGLALFSCCSSEARGASQVEAETRRARMVSVTSTTIRPYSPRHSENPPRYSDVAQQPLLTIDEKKAAQFEVFVQPETIEDDGASYPPLSPVSSIVSIPSTRYTNLTTMNTGDTTRTTFVARTSLETSSTGRTRPPSYHASARRSPSPAATEGSGRDSILQHPVMRRDWLEVLRQEAQREARLQSDAARDADNSATGAV